MGSTLSSIVSAPGLWRGARSGVGERIADAVPLVLKLVSKWYWNLSGRGKGLKHFFGMKRGPRGDFGDDVQAVLGEV